MPLYEYECARCGKRFELIQKFTDPPEATCLECGGKARRLLSAPSFHFKGTGWYVTDYARKPAPAEKSDSKAEGSEGEGKPKKKEEAAAPSAKSDAPQS